MIPLSNQITQINGPDNIINVVSQNLINTTYIGKGAGRYPTANSIMNDVVRMNSNKQPVFPKLSNDIIINNNPLLKWYLRCNINKDKINEILNTLSINGVIIKEYSNRKNNLIILTDKCKKSVIEEALSKIECNNTINIPLL